MPKTLQRIRKLITVTNLIASWASVEEAGDMLGCWPLGDFSLALALTHTQTIYHWLLYDVTLYPCQLKGTGTEAHFFIWEELIQHAHIMRDH